MMLSGEMLRPQERGPLTIEFFGLPGSGKSTIARELHGILARRQSDMIFAADMLRDGESLPKRVAAKAGLILGSLVAGRDLGLGSVLMAFRTPQPGLRDRVRSASSLATVSAIYSYLRRRRRSAILDQGALQCLWTVQLQLRSGTVGPLMDDLIRNATESCNVLISVETPPAICEERLSSRGSRHSRMQSSGLASNKPVWDHAERLRRDLLQGFRSEGSRRLVPMSIIVVDGRDDPKAVATRIAARLFPVMPEYRGAAAPRGTDNDFVAISASRADGPETVAKRERPRSWGSLAHL